MLIALDTATSAGGVAVADEGRILALRTFDAGREHSRRMFPEIEGALADAGRRREEIAAVAVTIGPGSFTGLRIALSAAKGLCFALGVPLVTVSTLEALAARLPWCALPVCAVLDARRGEVYAAAYDTSDGRPRALGAEEVLVPERLLARWGDRDVLFTGNGVDRWRELLASLPGGRLAPPPLTRPCAATVAWLGQLQLTAGVTADPACAEPVYLRTPSFATQEDVRAGRSHGAR